jgi:hypothetical protein
MSDAADDLELGKPALLGLIKRWGKTIGLVAGILSASGTIWKGFDAIDDLHDTILANKVAVTTIQTHSDEHHEQSQAQLRELATAITITRERDRDVITNLRIAVAALQAAQGARTGRTGYTGVENLMTAQADPSPPPRTARARMAQSRAAQNDAEEALGRAATAQATADREDPIARIRREWIAD